MTLNIRLAQRADLPRIVTIYNETIASHSVTADTKPVTVAEREAWFSAHNREKWPMWVTLDATGSITGWLTLSPYNSRAAYAETAEISIYLDEAARGQHLGSQLLDYVDEHAHTYGITHVVALIIGINQPSLGLFAKKGYTQWGLLPSVMQFADGPRDLVLMGRILP